MLRLFSAAAEKACLNIHLSLLRISNRKQGMEGTDGWCSTRAVPLQITAAGSPVSVCTYGRCLEAVLAL